MRDMTANAEYFDKTLSDPSKLLQFVTWLAEKKLDVNTLGFRQRHLLLKEWAGTDRNNGKSNQVRSEV
jgi:hypothetical protein